MPAVYSTITNDSAYTEYRSGVNDLPIRVRSVTIKGGAGVSKVKTMETPLGVRTEVSNDVLAFLEKDVNFQRHVQAGFLRVVKTGKPDVAAVAADMNQRDGCAPYVPNDFPEDQQPLVGDEKPVSDVTTKPRYEKPQGDFK